jgi:hypothetical protein
MTASITWVQIGDLHMDEADGWRSRDRLERIVSQINTMLAQTRISCFCRAIMPTTPRPNSIASSPLHSPRFERRSV